MNFLPKRHPAAGRVLIFDFDGTIFDTSSIAPRTTIEAVKRLRAEGVSCEMPTSEQVQSLVGLTAEEFWRALLPGQDDRTIERATHIEADLEQELLKSGAGRLYPGMRDALRRLAEDGWALYIASAGSTDYLTAAIEAAGLTGLFTGIMSGHDKADMVARILAARPWKDAVMVGDRRRDLDGARANGIPVIGCRYGFAEPCELDSADICIDAPTDLTQALSGLVSKLQHPGERRHDKTGRLISAFQRVRSLAVEVRQTARRPSGSLVLDRKHVVPQLIALAAPVMVTQVLFMLYDLVDAFWVGRLGVSAPAAVSLVGNLNWVLMVIGELVVAGNVALVARAWGAGDKDRARHVAIQSLFVSGALALIVGTAVFVLAGRILTVYHGISAETYTSAVAYLRVMAIGLAFSYVYGAITSTLQAAGDTVTPMRLGILSNVLNIVLDPLLIYGWGPFPRMGVLGAGVATVIGMGVYFVGAAYVILAGKGPLRVSFKGERPSLSTAGQLLLIGTPSALYGTTRPLTGMLMYSIAARFGDPIVAAFGMGGRVWAIVFVFLSGFFVATATLTGQALGAGKPDLARYTVKKSIALASATSGFFAILTILFARPIIGIFLKDPSAAAAGAAYLRATGVGFLAVGVSNPISGAFKGAGRNWPTLISAMIANWGVKVPVAALLAVTLGWGPDGIWWAVALSMIVEGLCLLVPFVRGRWAEAEKAHACLESEQEAG